MQKNVTVVCLAGLVLFWMVSLASFLPAQDSVESLLAGMPTASPGTAAELPALRVIRISGVLASAYGTANSSAAGSTASGGPQGVTFALYRDQEGGAPLWLETQNVQADAQGRYSVLLGSTQPEGLPLALFAAGEARWLGVRAGSEPEQPRVLLVSVPYALKAADAETLGGQPLSAFVLRGSPEASASSNSSSSNAASSDGPTSFTKAAVVVTPAVTGGTPNTLGRFDVDGVSLVDSSVREEPNAASSNLIGGFSGNVVTPGAIGAAISGGGIAGSTNRVTDHLGVVGGGLNNQAGDAAGTTADRAVATVGGGASNTAGGLGATVGGGVSNNGSGLLATVGGGFGNTASGAQATVGGGASNAAGGENATVPGGLSNVAAGAFSFAAGRRAQAIQAGTFVWADSTDADFASTLDNQFLIRAANGVGIGTATPTTALDVVGTVTATAFVGNGSGLTNLPGGGGGTVTSITAGTGLAASPGNPITTSGTLSFDTTFGDGRYSFLGHNHDFSYATLGANTFTGTQTITGGNLALPDTTGSSTGVISVNGTSFAHAYGTNNTFIGENAGNFSTVGTGENTAVGQGALAAITFGLGNTATGYQALNSNTSGYNNTASGTSALFSNTTGNLNTASGRSALLSNTEGTENTANGMAALFSNTIGNSNTASGRSALFSNTEGTANTASGYLALHFNTTGDQNTASGSWAHYSNTAGNANTALGYGAGETYNSLNANTTGSNNTFIGYASGPGTSTQLTNATAIGSNAVVSANNSLVLGSINGVNNATSSVNVGIGTATPTTALDVVGTVTATAFVGNGSGLTNLPGGGGTVTSITAGIGLTASPGNPITTSGTLSFDTAFGDGRYSFLGHNHDFSYATLGANTFTGTQTITGGNLALPDTTGSSTGVITVNGIRFAHAYGSDNTFVGKGAGNFTMSGDSNTASGIWALVVNTTGSNNTASGSWALASNTTGSNNTASGSYAGVTSSVPNSNTTGSNNTFIGFQSGPGVDGGTTPLTNATAIGASAVVSASNSLVLGSINGVNGATAEANVGIGTPAPDSRLHVKNSTDNGGIIRIGGNVIETGVEKRIRFGDSDYVAVGELSSADDTLELKGYQIFMNASYAVGIGTPSPVDVLQVVGDIRVGTAGTNGCVKRFDGTGIVGVCSSDARLKKNIQPLPPALAKVAELQPVSYNWRAEEFPEYHFGDARATGLIAQEVEEVFPEMVATDEKGYKAVDYTALRMLMLQAIRELKAENDTQREQLQTQNSQIQTQREQLRSQEERLQKLEAGVVLSQHTRTVASR